MCQHKRAILAACICGLWFFVASAASATPPGFSVEAAETWLREIAESDAFTAVEAPVREAYENLLRRSPAARRFDAFAVTRRGQATLVGFAFLFSILALGARRFRASGELTVALHFPSEIDGEFDVQLFRRSPRRGRNGGARSSASHTRSGVRRETQFDGIAPGVWFLQIEGHLRAPKSHASLATVCEEVEITIAAKQCRSVERTLPTVEVPIEFRIHWDRQPARDVGLSVRGRPESVRYAAQGRSQSTLPLGEHVMLIGAGDRVVETPISIVDYEPRLVQVDLATADGLVFKGCPPAVTPFLQGDLGDAARALERDGQAAVASLLLARLHQDQGQTERAAEQLENAGRKQEAAELRRSISDFDRAALLFEDAGDLRHAAEMYDAEESWPEAARAYSALEAWTDAVRCFERAGDRESLVGALEGQGELFKAAALAAELDDRARSIRLLQQVGPNHSEHGRAARCSVASSPANATAGDFRPG
jgi:hypothetical protein